MKIDRINIGNLFFAGSITMLLAALFFGFLAGLIYIFPQFLKDYPGFASLRPLHVSSALFWILLGATGCVYSAGRDFGLTPKTGLALLQWALWTIAVAGITVCYFTKNFGGREYWEFNPVWALPIAMAWMIFLFNFISFAKKIAGWPVYIWMWLTGIVFFLFTFSENYLWVFTYFRQSFITDTTIQWKVNGSLVGSWNQLLYGTALFLMERINPEKKVGSSRLAFALYFLGLFNLMFNWGHHIYTLPTQKYIRYVGYAVSMTEWVFLIKIIYEWKKSLLAIQKNQHYFPYRFLIAADVWVLINLIQAIFMSIPAINIYTHGTHVTVAHAMGTTIGINSMILLAACFEFLRSEQNQQDGKNSVLNVAFWLLQISLFVFWLSLNLAGITKGLWQLNTSQEMYSKMMDSLKPHFIAFVAAGAGLMIAFTSLAIKLLGTLCEKRLQSRIRRAYESEKQ